MQQNKATASLVIPEHAFLTNPLFAMRIRRSLLLLVLASTLLVSACAGPSYGHRTNKKRGCGCPGGFGQVEDVRGVPAKS